MNALKIFLLMVWMSSHALAENWPQFRGMHAGGVSSGPAAPTKWDLSTKENVRWRTPIPGLGLSSPIIWGDRIFITTATSSEDQSLKVGLYGDIRPANDKGPLEWKVICLDKGSGKVLWEKTATAGMPKIKRHTKASHANSSCATDGKHVVAFFGSEGLYCYSVDGQLIWQKDLGLLDSGFFMVPAAQWGFASSPVIFEDKLIVQCDVQKNSFVAAFDVSSGRELWRTARDEVPTWSTPTVHRDGDRTQVICNGYRQIAGYDVADGKMLWSIRGGGDIPVPTPVVAHNLIFITNAHGGLAPLYAVKLTATGDLTPKAGEPGKHLAWWEPRGGNYMQTPIVVGEYLYSCRDNGLLTCYEARSGKVAFKQRLESGDGFSASAVSAGGKLYYCSESGEVHVLEAGGAYRLIQINKMDESIMASPAVSEGAIYVRTRSNVYAIGPGH